MLHTFPLDALPQISSIYRIERQTVWQTCDRENILVLMVSGRCLFRLGSHEYAAGPNQLVFIPAGQDYQRRPLDDAPATFYYFHFALPQQPESRSTQELFRELSGQQAQLYLTNDPHQQRPYTMACLDVLNTLPDEAQQIAQQALAEYDSGVIESRLFYTLLLSRLIALGTRETVRQLLAQSSTQDDFDLPAKLKDAIVYIRSNHARALTVSEVCAHAGISRQHMIRLFRAELNMTPIQYINHTKIMHAKDLLWRDNNLSFKELSYELGFSDEHYFSRTFTHVAGETPTEFRKRVRSYASDSGQPK